MSAVRSPYTKGEVGVSASPSLTRLTSKQWYAQTALDIERNHIFSETNEDRHSALRTRMAAGVSGLHKQLDGAD